MNASARSRRDWRPPRRARRNWRTRVARLTASFVRRVSAPTRSSTTRSTGPTRWSRRRRARRARKPPASWRPRSSRSISTPRAPRRGCAVKWQASRSAPPASSSDVRSTRGPTRISSSGSPKRSERSAMADRLTIARPYARAAFEEARSHELLAPWSEALQVAAQVVKDPRVEELLGDPRVTPEQLAQLVTDIAGSKLDGQGANFVRTLADNHRLAYLPEISTLFDTLKDEALGVADVTVTSAAPLDA